MLLLGSTRCLVIMWLTRRRDCNGRERPGSSEAARGACDGTRIHAGEDADRLDRHGSDGLVDVRPPDGGRLPGHGLQPHGRKGQAAGREGGQARRFTASGRRGVRRRLHDRRLSSGCARGDARRARHARRRAAGDRAGGHDDQRAGPGDRDRPGRQGQEASMRSTRRSPGATSARARPGSRS